MIKKITYLAFILFYFIILFTYTSYSQFGKNIVQYETFDWKYIQSKHFDVYYNAGSKYLAEFTALSAEKDLLSIEKTLNYRIDKRIKIIVYDSHNEFQQTNVISQFMTEGIGGVTELMKNRVVIPFQGDYSQFDHVIHHELVHGVVNEMFYGGTFHTALQSGNLGKIPIWINEGLAEYESLGGLNIETDMFMRDVALSENLRDLNKMNNYFAYRGGQTFFWYISEKYGKEIVGDFMNRLKVSRNIENAFRSTFNMKIKDFSDEFKNALKKYYWPDIARYERPEDFAERITDQKKNRTFYNSSPAISPDGKKMAFISAPGGLFGVFVKNLEKKDEKPEKLVSSFRQQDFEDLNILTPGISWNPNGTKLAISAKAGGEDAIFIVDVNNRDYKKIKLGLRSITSVSWSPDGKNLAFIGSKIAESDIFIYNLTNKELTNLTHDVFSDYLPIWGPFSKNLFFISDRGDNVKVDVKPVDFDIWNYDFYKKDIYKINLNTNKITRITNSPDNSKTSIAVSSDGKNILYTSDKNGISNIYKLDLLSHISKPITNSLTGISQISLSIDDSKLLFTTLDNAGYDIFEMEYPLDRKFDLDTLPLTTFRESIIKKERIIDDISKVDDSKADTNDINKRVYGNFEVEFDRQNVVEPNPDAQEQNPNNYSETVKGLNDTSYHFEEHDYKITFTPDIINGNPGYSTFWGFQGVTQLLFSDVLGDHKIFVQGNIFTDLRNSTFYAAYLYQPKIIDYVVSIYHSAAMIYYGYDTTGRQLLYRFRDYGLDLMASYPLDLFNRVEWGLKWKNLSKENILNTSEKSIYRMLFIPNGRFVHDDVLYGMFAPIRGSRYFVGFMGTPKISNSGIGFLTVNADYRHYFQISDYSSIAIRATAGASMGPNPQNFYLGGTDYWINSRFSYDRMPFNEPEDFAFINSSIVMPLRGFGVGEISGNRYFLTNIEFRFPFIGWFFATPIPIAQSFFGAVFFDMGGAWSGDWNSFKSTKKSSNGNSIPKDLLMSSGIGIRTGMLGIPVKLDIAWAYLYSNWSKPQYLFSLGYDF